MVKKDDIIEPIDGTLDDVVDALVDGAVTKLYTALYQGPLPIENVDLDCAILDDDENTRVINMTSVFKAFDRVPRSNNRLINIPAFMDAKNLQPFVDQELIELIKPIEYIDGKTVKVGYNALILPALCDLYLKARRQPNTLTAKQAPLAEKAEILQSAFAKIGITALVDEATGFQYVRDKQALHKILDKFLQDDKRKWSKTFPDEFWFKLIKIKGYPSYMALNRPAFVGHWVNDIVYNRLAPGIREKLNSINPRIKETGRRKGTHTQHLTEDHGVPELRTHLDKAMVLMDASSNKAEFEKLLNKSMPKYDETIEMDI